MQVKLKVLGGAHEGKEIIIKDEKFLIGRSDSCQLRPKSDSISRKHCAIVQRDGRVLVADLKSRNGSFLNDQPLEPERAKVVNPGDILRVGQLTFEVLIEHGLGGAKKPQVSSVMEAAARMASEPQAADPKTDSFDVADWLIEADTMDRGSRRSVYIEPETKMLAMDETTNIELEKVESEADDDSQTLRKDKQSPMKLPKMKTGPATQNSKLAAEQTLKKFFGGR